LAEQEPASTTVPNCIGDTHLLALRVASSDWIRSRVEGQRMEQLLVFWGRLTLNVTQPRTSLGTRLRPGMSLRRLSDLMQIVKSLPGLVLDIFIQPPAIEIGPPTAGCKFGTLPSLWTSK